MTPTNETHQPIRLRRFNGGKNVVWACGDDELRSGDVLLVKTRLHVGKHVFYDEAPAFFFESGRRASIQLTTPEAAEAYLDRPGTPPLGDRTVEVRSSPIIGFESILARRVRHSKRAA